MATRRERVVLELEDRFTTPMAKAAASTALLNRELDSLSGSAVRSNRSVNDLSKSDGLPSLGKGADASGKQIDRLSGRLALLAQAASVLGPALVPMGAAAIPALSGMATQLTLTAAAAGTAALAFNGMGDGLKAISEYQLAPTAENLDKMRLAMEKLGPAGEQFARFLNGVGPQLAGLNMTAREGMFPGMEEGITDLLDLLPQVNRIVGEIAGAMGDLSSSAGAGLAGPRFAEFFDYLENEARPILMEMGRTLGNFADGFASMLVNFAPLTSDFSGGLENMSAAFAEWAHGLDSSDSFASFLDYIQSNGPRVLDMLGSLVEAFAGIVEAAAPVGAAVVPALTVLADVLASIAKSDIGTPIFAGLAAMSLLSRATATYGTVAKTAFGGAAIGSLKGFGSALVTVTGAQERATLSATAMARGETQRSAALRDGLGTLGKSAALMGGLALASSGAADSMGLSNTATMALMGTMAGPWGAAVGGGVGLLMDMAHANDDLEDSFNRLKVAMNNATPTSSGMAAFNAQIDESQAKLDGLVAGMEKAKANPMSDSGSGWWELPKNEIEGWFGDSDVEEYEAKLAHARDRARELGAQQTLTGASSRTLAMAMDQAAQAAFHESDGIQASIDAMRAKRDEALRAANAELNYEASLDDARQAVRENGRTLDITTAKGRANRSALLNQAAAWNGLSAQAKNTSGAHRQAIGAFVAVAVRMGMNEDAARRYARSLMEIPPKRTTQVTLESDLAMAKARAIKSELASIDRNVDIYINAHTTRLPSVSGMGPQLADGGYVSGPGGPRDDKIPAMLSNGEFVVNAAATSRNLGLLRQINARKFADGGLATSARGRSGDWGMDEAARGLYAFRGSLKAAKKALEEETNKRRELVSQRNELRGSIKDGLRTDLFAAPENPWAANATGGVMGTLKSDIGRGRHFRDLIKELRSKGLDGPALMEIISTGDVERAELYADMTRKGLNRFENLYEMRDKVLRHAGNAGGEAVFGAQIDRLGSRIDNVAKQINRLEHAVKHDGPKATGNAVGKAVNGASRNGHRRSTR